MRSPFEVSALEVHSEMNCIAEQLIELLTYVESRGAGGFCQGGQNLQKGHFFFVEKALPRKANFGSHAAI